jgi:hypothetical protein
MLIKCDAIKLGMEVRGQPFKCDGALMDYVRSLSTKRPKHYKLKQVQVNGQSYFKVHYKNG